MAGTGHGVPPMSGPGMPWYIIMIFFIVAIIWGVNEGIKLRKRDEKLMENEIKKLKGEPLLGD
tara:strand:+ start:3870 stop:4058 length:189 start_codon:yes stop_codon:yes gene_type:complete